MRNISIFILLFGLVLSACNKPFKKGDNGIEYKIISNGKGKKLMRRKFMQFHMTQFYSTSKKDSLLTDSRTTGGAMFEILDSASMPPELFKVCSLLRKGDSLVLRVSTDTIIKRQQGMVPPFIKKGNYFIQSLKVLNVFDTREQADKARMVEMNRVRAIEEKKAAAQLIMDDKTIQDYLKKNNITTVKAPEGTYVQIIKQGNGTKADTASVVKTNYTGKTFDGKSFDSNTDPSFGHVEPFMVNMTNDRTLGSGVIKGWTDGLSMLTEGAVAKFYIPSSLAYGSRGAGDRIPANANLMFDIEVVDVMNKTEARAANKIQEAKQLAEQKKYQDSIAKTSKPAPAKH